MARGHTFEPGPGHIDGLVTAIERGFDANKKSFFKAPSGVIPYFALLEQVRTATGLTNRAFGVEAQARGALEVFVSKPYGMKANPDRAERGLLPVVWQELILYRERTRGLGNIALVHVVDPGDVNGPSKGQGVIAQPDEVVLIDRRLPVTSQMPQGAVHYAALINEAMVDPDHDFSDDSVVVEEDSSFQISTTFPGTESAGLAIASITQNFVMEEFNELATHGTGPDRPNNAVVTAGSLLRGVFTGARDGLRG